MKPDKEIELLRIIYRTAKGIVSTTDFDMGALVHLAEAVYAYDDFIRGSGGT